MNLELDELEKSGDFYFVPCVVKNHKNKIIAIQVALNKTVWMPDAYTRIDDRKQNGLWVNTKWIYNIIKFVDSSWIMPSKSKDRPKRIEDW